MKSIVVIAALSAILAAQPTLAQTIPIPSEASVVQAQGAHAKAQLSVLGSIYSSLPAAAAREAFASGNATMDWRHWSPGLGGINRGPTLAESIYPLLANVAAAKASCPEVEGACQQKANAWAAARVQTILGSTHPGKALASATEEK